MSISCYSCKALVRKLLRPPHGLRCGHGGRAPRRASSAAGRDDFGAQSPSVFGRGWASGGVWQATPPSPAIRRNSPPPRLLRALALLRNPSELDGDGLGKAAAAAAREGLEDDAWWESFTARARELAPHLALHDASLVLNGMARARRLDRGLVEAMLPRICSNLVYLTSAHLAMVASAIAKAEVHNPTFVSALCRELKARLMEFQSPMEITMVVNAVSKLRVTDDDLYRRFLAHTHNRMAHEAFHVRDLSVLVSGLARVQCVDANTMGKFTSCAIQTLPQATPLELAKLMHACMSVGCSAHDFFCACVLRNREQTMGMDPGGLSSAAFAFGQCFEAAEVAHLRYLRNIFRDIRIAAVASLPLFLPREIVSLLRTYARWQVSFDCEHLRKVADRMKATREQFDAVSTVSGLYSLAVLMQRNAARSVASPATRSTWEAAGEAALHLLEPAWKHIGAGELDISLVLRAVEVSTILQSGDAALFGAVSACIVRRHVDFDGPSCSALYDFLVHLGRSPEEDVMLVLAAGASPTP